MHDFGLFGFVKTFIIFICSFQAATPSLWAAIVDIEQEKKRKAFMVDMTTYSISISLHIS